MQLTVYFDYLCPYAWRASRWLDLVVAQRPDVAITWRYFSLEQVNTPADSDWRLWEQSIDFRGRNGWTTGLHAFWASEAVRQQSEALFLAFRTAVYDARHEDKMDIGVPENLAGVAERIGVDMQQYQRDTQDRSLLATLQRDHEYAKQTYDCFGVPTLCFDDKNAVYVKLSEIVSEVDALPVFDDITRQFTQRPWLAELKRPNP
jgi:predicted DsbA family dithiol-disulfide isomerase